jgi:TPR repeat protein
LDRDTKAQSEAFFNMAAMLARGNGPFPRDKPKVFHFFEKAFALGHTRAITRLAGMHHLGSRAGNVVLEPDVEKAKEMYTRAMEEYSDPDAMTCLAHILRTEDKVRTTKIYQRLIDEFEDSWAMRRLAFCMNAETTVIFMTAVFLRMW